MTFWQSLGIFGPLAVAVVLLAAAFVYAVNRKDRP